MSRCRGCNKILASLQMSQKKYLDVGDAVSFQLEYEDMCSDCIRDSYQAYSILDKEYVLGDLCEGIKSPCKSSL